MAECKNCKRDYTITDGKNDFGFCRFHLCRKAQKKYYIEHFEELPDGKYRTRFENECYEINEVQKEKYAYFFSMIRHQKTWTTGRKCLGIDCGASMGRQERGGNKHLCRDCQERTNHIGALASC